MARDFKTRPTVNGTQLALTSELGGAGDHLIPLAEDAHAEADGISVYSTGFSILPVSAGANWGPNNGQAGHVITERNGSSGKQTFKPYSSATSYERTYTSGAWGSWETAPLLDLPLRGNQAAVYEYDSYDETDVYEDFDAAPHDTYDLTFTGGTFSDESSAIRSPACTALGQAKTISWEVEVPPDASRASADCAITLIPGDEFDRAKFIVNGHPLTQNTVYENGYHDLVLPLLPGTNTLELSFIKNSSAGTPASGYIEVDVIGHRYYTPASGATSEWVMRDFAPWKHRHDDIYYTPAHIDANFSGNKLSLDQYAESYDITVYPPGISIMPVTGGEDWGPNTGEAGHVVTERNGSEGKQTFTQYSGPASYERFYTSDAWGSWAALIVEGDSRLTNARTPTAHSHLIADLPVADDGESNSAEVVRSNDGRLSNARTPTDSSVTNAKVDAAAAIAESKLNLASDAAAGTASRRTLGTGATQATAGNDARLSDARTPTSHASSHQPGGSDAMAVDAAAATGSLRTLGTGAAQAAAGNDSRLSDARTPVQASETVVGGGELATQAETDTGTDDTRIVTPLKLKSTTTTPRAASETVVGGAELATQAETDTGTDDARIVTPLKLKTTTTTPRAASETVVGGAELATQAETDAETDDARIVTPLKMAAASLSHRKYDTGASAVTAEGDTRYDSTRRGFIFYDSVRERYANAQGFQPYAYPIGGGPTQVTTTALAIAANGGAIAIPVVLEGHMLLESVSFWNTDAATARGGAEFAIYEDRLDNANALDRIAAGTLSTWTPSAASLRTITATSAPVYLPPGAYWLLLKNNHASNTMGLGVTPAGTMAQNTAQTKTLTTAAFGTTLDLVAATWTKIATVQGVRLNGRVFGQAAAF